MVSTLTRPTQSALTLRPYQLEAVEAINGAEADGIRRPLVSLPTGTGKTVAFAHFIAERPGRALVLVHRDELLRQAKDKLLLVAPGMDIGIVKAEENEVHADVVLASVQTLSRENRLKQLYWDFTSVTVDEAHHCTADSYRRILEHVGSFVEDGPLAVGWTATPERGDKANLSQVWERIVFQKSLLEMILAGYLCDLKAVRVEIAVDLDKVHARGGDFIDSELASAMVDANAPVNIVQAYQEYAPDRKALVFVPSVALAHETAGVFRKAGVAAEALDATTPIEERRAILRRLHTGETMVLANCAVLTEGFDCPSVNCVITARPTKSKPFYQQMIGRGTRTYPGKEYCLILDLVGNSRRHELTTADQLFSMDLATSGCSVKQQSERATEAHSDDVGRAPDGRLVSSMVDLFRNRGIHWAQTHQGAWVLSLGSNGILRMASDGTGDSWSVVITKDGVSQVLKEGLPLGHAQGFSEDFARKGGLSPLLNPDATWRRQEPTDKQLMALRKWKVPIGPGLTKGTASDLLTAIFGDR